MSTATTGHPTHTATERPRQPKNRHRNALRYGGNRLRYAGIVALFLAPSLVPLTLFTLVPMVSSLWVSLHDWNLITPMEFVGLANYRELLSDGDTWAAFGHTLGYIAGYLPLVYVLGLAAALALNTALRGRNVFRAAYFLPVVTSWVVVALLWRWLLSPANGLVNHVLELVGVDGPGWWTDPAWAMPSVILASAWKDLGFVMIILLAGLQSIPGELYDAARVDGTSAWQRFRYVTLPLLSPSTFFVVVISLINGFQVFDQVYVMTGGGPAGATEVVVQQIYDLTFRYGRAGDASALSWLLFVVVLVVTIIQVRGQRRWVTYA
ncbi:sugar ABC transporter permease [Jiangella aurantiaca]|uniref:Sugar ABC transporter permease n=1 Tax=Jiangella aurantiaca TaxID=2530373 RepID=A0A4R5ADW4_9ACTN|nr:sugar ABC transporter permease [Jiangella aurantiaca]TDD70501.1 sugar ABC transporter permease [Jiangella aurantiaca]